MPSSTTKLIVTIMTALILIIILHIPAAAVIHDTEVGNFFFSPLKTVCL